MEGLSNISQISLLSLIEEMTEKELEHVKRIIDEKIKQLHDPKRRRLYDLVNRSPFFRGHTSRRG